MRRETRDADFSEYVVAQRVRMVRAARLLTAGDDAAAEDLVQTTLTRLYVQWPRVSGADDPIAYGFRSLTNAFLDERQRAHRRHEVVTERQPEHPAAGRTPRPARWCSTRSTSWHLGSVRSSSSATSSSTTSRRRPRPGLLGRHGQVPERQGPRPDCARFSATDRSRKDP